MAETRAEPSKESSCKLAGKANSAGSPGLIAKGWTSGSLCSSFSVLWSCFLIYPKSLTWGGYLFPTVHSPTEFSWSCILSPHLTPWGATQDQPIRKASPIAQGFARDQARDSNWPIRAFPEIFCGILGRILTSQRTHMVDAYWNLTLREQADPEGIRVLETALNLETQPGLKPTFGAAQFRDPISLLL